MATLNEMKLKKEKWTKHLDEYRVDVQLIEQTRKFLSKLVWESKNLCRSLLNDKCLMFTEDSTIDELGEIVSVSLH